MPDHDATAFRDQLASLMAAVNAQLAALEVLLAQEYELLQARNAEGLEQAGAARQECVGHILRLEDERNALCRAAGHGNGPSALHTLLSWCDPSGLLRPAMQEYRDRTVRCREQNDRNGMLVNSRLQQEGRTYGPGSDSSGDYGRKLTTRA